MNRSLGRVGLPRGVIADKVRVYNEIVNMFSFMDLGQIKKLEEAKQLGALSEKLEKCQKKEVKLTEKKAQLEGK